MFVPLSNSVVAGRYELIDEIGRGGMGVVWRARQANLGIECAVKFIHAAQAHDPEVRRRFVREARAAASLKSPNSVHILDVDEWQGTLFIAMELLSGESLEARLARERTLPPQLTLDIIEQVARGLNKAHTARLVHRDLKPENIFLVDEDPLLVKILDFGIAKRIDAGSGLHTTSGVLVGTPGYMSPEQAHGGKEIDYRSDLWSLAVVVYRCLTGAAPFEGEGLGQVLVKVMTGPIPSPRSVCPSLPPRVEDWWFRVLQRDPALRPASALALVNGLRDALADVRAWQGAPLEPGRGLGAESLQPTLQPVSSSPARRGRSLRVLAISVAALLPLVVFVVARWQASLTSAEVGVRATSERAALYGRRATREPATPAAAPAARSVVSTPPATPRPALQGAPNVGADGAALGDGGVLGVASSATAEAATDLPGAANPPAAAPAIPPAAGPALAPSTPNRSKPEAPSPAAPTARPDAQPAAPSAASRPEAPEAKPSAGEASDDESSEVKTSEGKSSEGKSSEGKPSEGKPHPAKPREGKSPASPEPSDHDVFENPWPPPKAPGADPRLGF